MTLADSIRSNKRKSFLLVFVLAILTVATGYAVGYGFWGGHEAGLIALAGAFALVLIMTLVSYFSGDMITLALSGAKEIKKPDNPQLFNVVEEMSIASGLPMPRVFIINDGAPNAFATGRKPEKSAVAVTTGLLERLNRDELQGVIAHEMSHIQNYDILFATMIGIMVGTIVLISDVAIRSLFFGRRRRSSGSGKGGGGAMIIMLIIALVLIILSPILAKIIQMAVSRRREYLADASGAKLTRYPEGLASALEKIAFSGKKMRHASRATQHMFIVNPLKPTLSVTGLMSTHPPAKDRIERLRSM